MSYTNEISDIEKSNFESIHFLDMELISFAPLGNGKLIKNKIIEAEFIFKNEYRYSLHFEKCYFKKAISFKQAFFYENVTFQDCYFDQDFTIGFHTTAKKSFALVFCNFKHHFLATSSNFKDCFWKIRECENFRVDNLVIEKMDLDFSEINFPIKNTTIANINQYEDGELKITYLSSEYFNLIGQSKKLNIQIVDCKIDTFEISEYRNDGLLRLSNINTEPNLNYSLFGISNSQLGKAEFHNIDFSRYANFHIGNSNLIDCSFVNIIWNFINAFDDTDRLTHTLEFKISIIEKNNPLRFLQTNKLRRDDEVILYYAKLREIYRQLKFAMSKQGDVINEQKFHGCEMDAYDKSLLWSKSLWTKMVIRLSKMTSDFGQSVKKPIIYLLLVHFILFIWAMSVNVFSPLHISFLKANWNSFWKAADLYFETINPFRKTETGRSWVIIDLLMRIWASYMIYNFIRASRRFIK